MKAKANYIHSFTGLRALALWAVILYHLFPNKIQGGYLGVVVFFVLSGFLLMRQYLLLDKKNPLEKLKGQYKKLFPAMVFMVSTITLFVALFYPTRLPLLRGSGLAALLSVNNWHQVYKGLSYFDLHGSLRPFTPLWTLSVEMQFYLIWALLTRGRKKNLKLLTKSLLFLSLASMVLMMVLSPLHQDPTRVYYGTDTRFFSFGIGALFGLAATRGAGNRPQKDRGIQALVLVLILVLSFIFFAQGPLLYYGGMVAITLLVGLLCVFISKDDNIGARVLSHPLLTFFGKRAYSYYLWQYALMLVFQQIFSHSTLAYSLEVLLQLGLLLILGEISYRLWEQKRGSKKILLGLTLLFLGLSTYSYLTQEEEEVGVKQQIEKIHQERVQEPREEKVEKTPDQVSPEVQDKADQINQDYPAYSLTPADLGQLSHQKGLLIGDSITESAAPSLQEYFPQFQIDGKINRQMAHAIDLLGEYDLGGPESTSPIIIQLGTNSDFNESTLEEIIKRSGHHPLYLVNTAMPDPWEETVNHKLEKAAQSHSGVYIIDWYGAAKKEEDLFFPDHTHPQAKGENLLAHVIGKALLGQKKDQLEK